MTVINNWSPVLITVGITVVILIIIAIVTSVRESRCEHEFITKSETYCNKCGKEDEKT